MTDRDIINKFNQVIQDKDAMKAIGATKYQLYNWRNPDRAKTSIGSMLEVLFKLNLIELKK